MARVTERPIKALWRPSDQATKRPSDNVTDELNNTATNRSRDRPTKGASLERAIEQLTQHLID